MPLGVILGLSPLSGDGLIYSGHPIQGVVAMGIQLGGLFGGLAYVSQNKDNLGDLLSAIGTVGLITVTTSISTFLWDAIGTPIYIHQHNKRLRETTPTISPAITSSRPGSLAFGLNMRF